MVTDKISELIISLKNASMAGKDTAKIHNTKMNVVIVEILKNNNFIADSNISKDKKEIIVTLRYDEKGVPAITDVKRVSKLSKRIYKGADEIRRVKNGFGLSVITTPLGLLTDQQAREKNVGGEMLFQIW
jgi:small subunit ribosomal protein S8